MSIKKASAFLLVGAILLMLYPIFIAVYDLATSSFPSYLTQPVTLLMQLLEVLAGVGLLIFAIAVRNEDAANLLVDSDVESIPG